MSIHVDPTHGHITARDENGQVLATVMDMGATCAVDATVPYLTPDQAYEYAHAVFHWAAAKRRQARERAREAST